MQLDDYKKEMQSLKMKVANQESASGRQEILQQELLHERKVSRNNQKVTKFHSKTNSPELSRLW